MSDIGGAGGEDLPDLVSHIVVDPDLAGNTARIEKLTAAQVDQLKRAAKRWAEINEKANAEMQRQTREHLKKIIDIRRGAAREEQRLALTAGSEAGKLERAKGQEIVKAQRASQEVAERELKRHYAFNVKTRSRFFDDALRALNAGAKKERDARQHADAQDRQDQERQHKWSHYQERAYWSALGKLWDHFLKERRRKARAADFERLADQKHEHRTAYAEQVHQNALDRAREKGHQDRLTAMSRSFWSSMRSLTETGGRFVSSISQSFLRSMGNAFAEGFRRITGTYRRGTDMNERVLRDSLSDQQRAVTVALARQEGAYAAFQQTAQRGALGGILNARNALLGLGGLGGFLSARAIFGPVADYQQTQIAFEALLGSAQRATGFLTQLRNFAEVTPFDFRGVSDGARRLLAVGFAARDVIPTLTDIGNVAANLGAGTEEINGVIRALGQMKGKGKASAEELNQISEQLPGFSAVNAIAHSLGITVGETFDMMKKGALPADVAIQAILQGMRDMPGAAGAMDRQSRTLNGRLSTLKDTIQNLVIDALNPFMDGIAAAVGLFTSFIESLFKGKGIWAVVRSGLLGIAVALGAIAAQKGAAAALQLVGAALKVIAANPLTALAIALATIGTILYRHNPDFRKFVDGFLDKIGEFVDRYSGPVSAFLERFATGVTGVVSALASGDWDGAYQQIAVGLTRIRDMLEPATDFLVNFGEQAWESWQEWLDNGGLGDLADEIKWRILDGLIKVRDGVKSIDWPKFLKPLAIGLAVGIGAILLGLPGWLVAGAGALVTAYFTSPRFRRGVDETFDKIGEFISEKWTEMTGDIDWGKLWTDALVILEQGSAVITQWLVEFIGSPEFQTAIALVTAALVSALGAILVGVIEGLIASIPKLWEESPLFGKGGLSLLMEQLIVEPLNNFGFDFSDFGRGMWDAFSTGILATVFDIDWSDTWSRAWSIVTRPFSENLRAAAEWMMREAAIQFAMFERLGGIIIRAIVRGLDAGNDLTFAIANGIIDALNGIIDFINDQLEFEIRIGPIARQINAPDIGHIPHMAEGGIVTKPTLALIGEAGPEAVVPLSNGMGSLPLSLSFDATAIAGQVDAIAALLAPLGDRIMVATQPGMDRWKASMDAFLDGIYTGFTTWGDRMVQAGTDIGTAIAGALTSTLREGRQQVVGITRGYARSLVSALNPLLSGIGEEPITLNFARGGIAEAYQGAQVHVFNEGRRGRGSSHGEAYIPFDPANRSRSRSLTDETARRLGGEVHWYAQGGLSPDAIRRGQSFARAQAGKPYVWGGVGPNGFDCSGLASAIVNVIQNSPHPYARRFTSATLTSGGAVAGLIPGPGQVTIGARPGRPGHVTTNIAGLKAEATNGAVRVGPTAAAVSGFSSLWHLGSGVFIGADGTVYPIPRVPDAGSHGWLSSTARSAMRFVRRKARSWVDANTYTGSTSALESVMNGMQSGPASPELMATIRRAMSIAGVPSSWLGPLLTLISRESSYNPRAFNRTLGASGLMQTIPSTFARYALPGYGGIFDPLANVIAGLRYILDRYGSIFNVGQAVSPSPTRGYSYGGVVDRDGIYRLAEGNRREVVLPLENKGRLMELLRRTGLDETISLALGEYPTPTKGAGATTGGATPTIGSVIGEMHVHSNSMDPATVGRIAARRTADEVRSALAGVA